MKILPQAAALLALVVMAMVSIGRVSGQGLFGQRENGSPVLKKAKRYNLVPVEEAAPGVFIDLQYKITSAANKPLYLQDMPCLIHVNAGKKLRAAQREVAAQGYALKIWDAWRPPEAHQALWDAVKDPRYVVPPENGLSWHCFGLSVDLTLVKADGSPCKMPTKFDALTKDAASDYRGNDPEIKRNLSILQNAMAKAGFRKINDEWWHFDDADRSNRAYKITAADLGIALPP